MKISMRKISSSSFSCRFFIYSPHSSSRVLKGRWLFYPVIAIHTSRNHAFPLGVLVGRSMQASHLFPLPATEQQSVFLIGANADIFGQQVSKMGRTLQSEWSFIGGSKVFLRPKVARIGSHGRGFSLSASLPFPVSAEKQFSDALHGHQLSTRKIFLGISVTMVLENAVGLTSTQIASNAFTIGTAAVLPFYTLMVVAPKAELTKRTMESNIPYVALGILYAYLLYLSWTPDTLRTMFASKYWLPELPGIAKMFSNEMTLASAWVHLLAVDLFAARQVFHDGLKNKIETRHSVSLCLLFCPIGILTHAITKVLAKRGNNMK